ncbi:MAG: CCA tRNA nucleotidyltransferase [Bdellovibrionota bacterium]
MRFQLECLQKSDSWKSILVVQQQIVDQGFIAYLAGGAVRDAFLGVIPHDFDLVTDASVQDLQKIFKKVVLVGESFGVIRVIESGHTIEVAQFRKESDYKDGRHPSLVSAATPEEDALRRDFTVNALFYDFSTGKVLDFVGGLTDLENRKLRCVGNSEVRFQEDHLRILRAIRLEAQLGFTLNPETKTACENLAPLTLKVSKERIQDELIKMITGPRPNLAIQSLWNFGLMKILFPQRAENYQEVLSQIEILFKYSVSNAELALTFFAWRIKKSEDFFKNLKWPKKSEKNIQTVLNIFMFKEEFLRQRLGEQLLIYQDNLFQKVLVACQDFYFDSKEKEKLSELKNQWIKVGQNNLLPAPLVKAIDLPENYQGSQIGSALKEAFLLQLENPTMSKTEIKKALGN